MMMNYQEAKRTLRRSEAMQKIPDRWEESVPTICDAFGGKAIAFLYWVPSDSRAEMKRMITVHLETGELTVLDWPGIQEQLGLKETGFALPSIKDYGEYFRERDSYEALFEAHCDHPDTETEYNKAQRARLLRSLVGEELFLRVFVRMDPGLPSEE